MSKKQKSNKKTGKWKDISRRIINQRKLSAIAEKDKYLPEHQTKPLDDQNYYSQTGYYSDITTLDNIPKRRKANSKKSKNRWKHITKRKLPQILSIGDKRPSNQYDVIGYSENIADMVELKTAEMLAKNNRLAETTEVVEITIPEPIAEESKVVQADYFYYTEEDNAPVRDDDDDDDEAKAIMAEYNSQFAKSEQSVPEKKKPVQNKNPEKDSKASKTNKKKAMANSKKFGQPRNKTKKQNSTKINTTNKFG